MIDENLTIRTDTRMNDPMHKALKDHAAKRGLTFSQLIRQIVAGWLRRQGRKLK